MGQFVRQHYFRAPWLQSHARQQPCASVALTIVGKSLLVQVVARNSFLTQHTVCTPFSKCSRRTSIAVIQCRVLRLLFTKFKSNYIIRTTGVISCLILFRNHIKGRSNHLREVAYHLPRISYPPEWLHISHTKNFTFSAKKF